jgi:hypothetical protein
MFAGVDESNAVGVGHTPPSLPSMRGSNIGCAVQSPFRIEAELGKVCEDSG